MTERLRVREIEDRVRDVIRNFSAGGFGSLYRMCMGGRPPKFTLPQRREVKKVAESRPGERYSALDGTDHASHREQASMIRRYSIWRNNHAYDERLRRVVARANVA